MESPVPLEKPQHFLLSSTNQGNGAKIRPLPFLFEIKSESSPASTLAASLKEKYNSNHFLVSNNEVDAHPPLPRKRQGRIFRHARHTFFNVYRRLFSVVFILNSIGVIVLFLRHRKFTDSPGLLADLADIAAANIMVALLVRQDYIVNAIFK